ELAQTPGVCIIHRQRKIEGQLPLNSGRGLKQERSPKPCIDLANGAGWRTALLSAQSGQRSGIRNVGEECRVAYEELRLVDAVQLGRIQRKVRGETIVKETGACSKHGSRRVCAAASGSPRNTDARGKIP